MENLANNKINFISSKDSKETHNMSTKRDNVKIIMRSETEEIIKKRFKSLLQKYQEKLGESMKGSEFVFDSVD